MLRVKFSAEGLSFEGPEELEQTLDDQCFKRSSRIISNDERRVIME